MIFCKNTIFAFLLIGALFCYSHAELYPDEVLIDSTYTEQSSSSNTGLVIGSVLTGIGVIFFIAAANTSHTKQDKPIEDVTVGVAEGMAAVAIGGLGVIFSLIGLPILLYNICSKISASPDHPLMNDDFVFSPGLRKTQKSSVQIQFTPTINFMNSSAGFNATLKF